MAESQIMNLAIQYRSFLRLADSTLKREWGRELVSVIEKIIAGESFGGAGQAYTTYSTGGVAATSYPSQIVVADGQAYATQTITLVSASAGNHVAVNGVHFIAVSGTAVVANGEFKVGVTDTADALSLVAAINGSTNANITGILTASSALGVVTLTPVMPGTIGNTMTVQSLGIMASGALTGSSTAGTLTSTINGVAITSAAGATDTLSATVAAAAINASTNPLVFGHVFARSAAGVVTVYAKYPGIRGNAITLAASGTGWTAGAARLASGANTQWQGVAATGTLTLSTASGTVGGIINGVTVTVSASGGDTTTATAIRDAINSSVNALVQGLVIASASGAVVTITALAGGLSGNAITLAASGTGVTASVTRLATGAVATQTTFAGTVTQTFPGARFASGAQNAPVTIAG